MGSFAIEESFVYYMRRTDWMVNIAILKAIQSFVDGLGIHLFVAEHKDTLRNFILGVLTGFADLKYNAVRHQAVVALYKLLKSINDFEQENQIKEHLVDKDVLQTIKDKIDYIVNNDDKP